MLTLLLALATLATPAPTVVPVSDYAKPPTVESMKMSPDGRYLAMVAPQSDYETQLEDDEAHGFYRQDHRLAVFERVLKFLGEHTQATPASSSP